MADTGTPGTSPDLDGMVNALAASPSDLPTVLSFVAGENAANRSIWSRMFDMFKGAQPHVEPDGDEGAGAGAGDGDGDEGAASGGRGAAYLAKGFACKGKGCGWSHPMQKGHPHYGAKRGPAEEVAKMMHCPGCGEKSVQPVMMKGDEEMVAPRGPMSDAGNSGAEDEGDGQSQLLSKGQQGALDAAVTKIGQSVDASIEAAQAIPGMASAILDTFDMLKGLVEQIEVFSERLQGVEMEMSKGADFQERVQEFNSGMLLQFEEFARSQDALTDGVVSQVEMLKGLEGALAETSEMVKGLEPRTPKSTQSDRSAFDRAAHDVQTRGAVVPKDTDMNKGTAPDGALTEDELALGVQRGIISRANMISYRLGHDLPNGLGRDAVLFRRKLQG